MKISPLKVLMTALLCGGLVLGFGARAWAEEEHGGGDHADHHAQGDDHGQAKGDAHDDAHGGHKVKHLENWFSLSFGPGKKYQNGPFAFAILNFILLIIILVRFAKKPFREYLQTRHATIRDNLAEAATMRDEARQKLDEIQAKLTRLDTEIAEIKAHVAKDAELEKDRIIKTAEAEAERLIKAADKTLDKDIRRARRMLETEAINAALGAAEKLVKQQVNEADRNRLNEEYFEQIASSGGNN
jgi:F-type H+-transporting ATPase subunit b